MAAPILWTRGKIAFFLQENPLSIKFLVLGRGGYSGVWGGGVPILFLWADFSEPGTTAVWPYSTGLRKFGCGFGARWIILICCRVKTWPKNNIFLSQKPCPIFLCFFFFCFSKFFFLQGKWDFKEKRATKRIKKHIFWVKTWSICCATCLDQVLTQPWTKFRLNIFAKFGGIFTCLKNAETTIFIHSVFSQKKLSPPQKIEEH